MAEVKLNRESQGEQSGRELEQTGRGRGISRRGDYYPSFFQDPGEFFRASPFGLMRRMSEEMDRMFSSSWFGGERGWAPAVEVSEREGNLVVCADLPGLEKDDVKVEVTDDSIVIQGERRREQEDKREGYYRSERSYGSFYRAVPLPENANGDQATASFHNGVLEVSVPLAENRKRNRRINIETRAAERKPAGGEPTSAQQEQRKKTA
jgi:HSP20 family protein